MNVEDASVALPVQLKPDLVKVRGNDPRQRAVLREQPTDVRFFNAKVKRV